MRVSSRDFRADALLTPSTEGQTVENPYTGIAPGARLALQRLGHQNEQLVVKHNEIPKQDAGDGLRVCDIRDVFANPRATFIVFGTPNVSLVMPHPTDQSWDRLAAFMFWRDKTRIDRTKERVQAGVLCELRDLGDEAIAALRASAESLVGTRKASCAHSVALALHRAGFKSSKEPLRLIYRPSHLAAVLWNGELTYKGEQVELRWITTDKSAHDHFLATWHRERRSLSRLVAKMLYKVGHKPAPTFDADLGDDMSGEWPEAGPRVRVSINRPSPLGVNLSYVIGQQPEYSMELPGQIDEPLLAEPLKPFDRKLDKVTFVKSKVLFSPLTCWLMAKILEKDVGTTDFLPTEVVAKMLKIAPSTNPEPLYKYNFVLTKRRFKIKRLTSNNGRDNKFLAWMLAKHVLLSRWAKDVLAAGELWACLVNGRLTIFINGESGSYQPTNEQLEALARVLSKMLDLPVLVGPRPTA